MKKLIIAPVLFFSLSAFAGNVECLTEASKISLTKKEVIIEESNVAMTDELRQLAANMTGGDTSATYKIGVKISFPKKDLKCTDGLAKVTNCQGSTKKASVTLSVSQQSIYGSSSMESMRRPVKIENIEISTSLNSTGPIVLGSEPTTVELNQLTAKSSMLVRMSGDFPLNLEQKFESSLCK